MSSLTGWVKNEEDYSLFPLNVNLFNNNLRGEQCYFTGKCTLDRCALKSYTLFLNCAEPAISFFYPLLPTVRTLFILRKPGVLSWFCTVVTKTVQTTKALHQKRQLTHLGKYVDPMTLAQVPVTANCNCGVMGCSRMHRPHEEHSHRGSAL